MEQLIPRENLTGNWQKESCTTKAVRKIHTCLGRKERKVIGSGPVPLGEDSEETGNYTGEHLLWRVSSMSHRLDSQSWGPMRKTQTPFTGLRTTGTDRETVGSLGSAHQEHAHTGSACRQGRERSALEAAGFPTNA